MYIYNLSLSLSINYIYIYVCMYVSGKVDRDRDDQRATLCERQEVAASAASVVLFSRYLA